MMTAMRARDAAVAEQAMRRISRASRRAFSDWRELAAKRAVGNPDPSIQLTRRASRPESEPRCGERGRWYVRVCRRAARWVRSCRAHDWSRQPARPDTASWPQSLRTAVGIMLTSRYAMWMAWGPD